MDIELGSVEAMVFDVDGTLIDSAYQHTLAWARAFADVGVQVPSWWIHRHVGMGGDHLVEAVAGEDVEQRLGDRVRELESGRYQDLIDEVRPFPAAKELLATCRAAGLRVILASSAKGEELEHYLGLLDARQRAHDWTSAPDVENTKPDPDLIEVALEKAGTCAAVMVGDAVWDVVAATRAGIPSLGLLTGGVGACELEEAGAVAVFESLEELQGSLEASLLPSLTLSMRSS